MNLFESLAVFTGGLPGISIANVIGVNTDIDTATTPECVITQGGMYSFLSAASSLEIVSDNAADAAAGTGLRTARLDLLDANYVQSTVQVTMNGITPVAISGTWLRINDLRTNTVGSGEQNAGTVTVRVAGGGATQAVMLPGKGRAQQAIYTVPRGLRAFAVHAKVGIIKAKTSADANVELQTRAAATGGGWITRNTVQVSVGGNVSDISNPPFPPPVFATNDVRLVVTDVSANDTAVHAALQMLIVDLSVCRLPSTELMRYLNPGTPYTL